MFRIISKKKLEQMRVDYDLMRSKYLESKRELDKLRSMNERDLVRAILGHFKIDKNFGKDAEDNDYQDDAYVMQMAILAQNETLKNEIKKIINESVFSIATQSPKDTNLEMLYTGNINACDILLDKLNSANVFIEQKKNDGDIEA